MDSSGWITTITLVLSVTSVIARRAVLDPHRSASATSSRTEREARLEEQSAIKAAERVYEPLAQAAAELQSRIFNIVETGWLGVQKRYESHGDYAATSAPHSCSPTTSAGSRRAARRCSPPAARAVATSACSASSTGCSRCCAAAKTARGSCSSPPSSARSASSCSPGRCITETGAAHPARHGLRGLHRAVTATTTDFSPWFAPVTTGLDLVSKGDNTRLVAIQHALVRLIDELDPKRKYTAGFDLQPIELGDAHRSRLMTDHIIVLPGGGYQRHAPHEGEPVAEWLRGLGLAASVFAYPVTTRHPGVLDAVRAEIQRVRDAGASGWGSSASPRAGMPPRWRRPARPRAVDLVILGYPVVSMLLDTHKGSRDNLLGPERRRPPSGPRPPPTCWSRASSPPFFIWHTADDAAVPVQHSYLLGHGARRGGRAARAARVPARRARARAGGRFGRRSALDLTVRRVASRRGMDRHERLERQRHRRVPREQGHDELLGPEAGRPAHDRREDRRGAAVTRSSASRATTAGRSSRRRAAPPRTPPGTTTSSPTRRFDIEALVDGEVVTVPVTRELGPRRRVEAAYDSIAAEEPQFGEYLTKTDRQIPVIQLDAASDEPSWNDTSSRSSARTTAYRALGRPASSSCTRSARRPASRGSTR